MLCMLPKPLCSIELLIVYQLDGCYQADLLKLSMPGSRCLAAPDLVNPEGPSPCGAVVGPAHPVRPIASSDASNAIDAAFLWLPQHMQVSTVLTGVRPKPVLLAEGRGGYGMHAECKGHHDQL